MPQADNKAVVLGHFPRSRAIKATDTGTWYIFANEQGNTPIIGEGNTEAAAWAYARKAADLRSLLPVGPYPPCAEGNPDWLRGVERAIAQAKAWDIQPNYADKSVEHQERLEAWVTGGTYHPIWFGHVVTEAHRSLVLTVWGSEPRKMFDLPGLMTWKPL